VDKHSTGGIGDGVSLLLAPLVAACGGFVPMISGRGLGHTGGTLDKLESVPGLRVAQDVADLRRIVAEAGCAIVAAGPELAPADARLYAIRDETGTVGSVDLITASILSKKLAAGLDGLVLDVKQGSGAFLRSPDAAAELARALVRTAQGAGCATRALITDMDQPLARVAGNALEMRAAVALLTGRPVQDGLPEGAITDGPRESGAPAALSLALAGHCLSVVGLDGAAARVGAALESGAAAERLARMIAAQGGPADLLDRPDHYLPGAPVVQAVPGRGRVAAIDTEALGHAVVALGGGRLRAGDRIDPRVGLSGLLRIGEEAGPDRPLAFVHAASEGAAQAAAASVASAYLLGEGPAPGPLIRAEVDR
jgi:thymidine phosphorylase